MKTKYNKKPMKQTDLPKWTKEADKKIQEGKKEGYYVVRHGKDLVLARAEKKDDKYKTTYYSRKA